MASMFDHVTLGVSDIARARRFYLPVMAALDLPLAWENATMLTFSTPEGEDFGVQQDRAGPRHGTHVAFLAKSRATVDRFHAAALAAGGTDAGAPGLRPAYAATYYAAFVTDPDGNRLEAVCHDPDQSSGS